MIDDMLNLPYRVIDILPETVPDGGFKRYAAVEDYFLRPPRIDDLRRRFAMILLLLGAYDDLTVMTPGEDMVLHRPDPDRLTALLAQSEADYLILIQKQNCLITVNRGDTYMTVYGGGEKLLGRIGALAASQGLFLREPPREGDV